MSGCYGADSDGRCRNRQIGCAVRLARSANRWWSLHGAWLNDRCDARYLRYTRNAGNLSDARHA